MHGRPFRAGIARGHRCCGAHHRQPESGRRDIGARAGRDAGPCAGAAGGGMKTEERHDPRNRPPLHRHRRTRRPGAGRRPAGRGAGKHDHHPRHAVSAKCRDGGGCRADHRGGRRGAGDDRRHRRPAEGRPDRCRARRAGAGLRRDEAVARRSRLRGRRSAGPAARRSRRR